MNMQSADFSSYTLEDFIDHPRFILWVSAPDPALDAFWQKVQEDYPETVAIITDARKIVLSLRFQQEYLNSAEQQSLWNAIAQQSKLYEKPVFRLSFWLRSAAAVLLLGLLAISFFFYQQYQKITVDTRYGQVKTLTLPDGTIVTLNANSKLRYPKNWNSANTREVWIEGEAFFKVNHLHKSGVIKEGDHFVVHAQKLKVEVLGTSFNVNNRRGLVKVALATGRVGLEVKGLQRPLIKLQPGDLAEYREKEETIVKRKIYTPDYVSWKTGELHFNSTPLSEVLRIIEDDYGDKAILKDPAIGYKRLSGNFSVSSEDALLKAISTSLGISIQKDQAAHQLIIN
ncbi:FecR family protein [Pedobacter sp. L105]|uniref:FecR family protein n=1 Tax=Pedobacter sp. L105 TaxID=1641871 RepID=UPI00131DD44D|nr:FecR domain-containing protein [Pedobacter sp. L105]